MKPAWFTALIILTTFCISCHSPATRTSYNPLSNMVAVPLTHLPSHHYILEVEIGNVTGIFLLDTGANRTVIRDNRLSYFHIERSESAGQSRLINIDETSRGRVHDIDGFAIDNIRFPMTQLLSMDLDHLLDPIETTGNITIDGVLGMDALLSLGTLIDIRTETLYIEPVD